VDPRHCAHDDGEVGTIDASFLEAI